MGEIIKVVDEIIIGDAQLMIELNQSTTSSEYKEIHIQNDKFRLAIPENEFLQMASCFLLAKKQMDILKHRG